MIADNRLGQLAAWDKGRLGVELKALKSLDLDFRIEATGFAPKAIDLRIEAGGTRAVDAAGSPSEDGRPSGRPMDRVGRDQRSRLQERAQVARAGDVRALGPHRLVCSAAAGAADFAAIRRWRDAAADGARLQSTGEPFDELARARQGPLPDRGGMLARDALFPAGRQGHAPARLGRRRSRTASSFCPKPPLTRRHPRRADHVSGGAPGRPGRRSGGRRGRRRGSNSGGRRGAGEERGASHARRFSFCAEWAVLLLLRAGYSARWSKQHSGYRPGERARKFGFMLQHCSGMVPERRRSEGLSTSGIEAECRSGRGGGIIADGGHNIIEGNA